MNDSRDCNNCTHHKQGRSLNDTPAFCHDCIHAEAVRLPHWEPKEVPMTKAPDAEAFRLQSLVGNVEYHLDLFKETNSRKALAKAHISLSELLLEIS